jgi:hypothetical protein
VIEVRRWCQVGVNRVHGRMMLEELKLVISGIEECLPRRPQEEWNVVWDVVVLAIVALIGIFLKGSFLIVMGKRGWM